MSGEEFMEVVDVVKFMFGEDFMLVKDLIKY